MKIAMVRFFPARSYRRCNGENVHLSADMPPILPCLEKLGSWGKCEVRSPGLPYPCGPLVVCGEGPYASQEQVGDDKSRWVDANACIAPIVNKLTRQTSGRTR